MAIHENNRGVTGFYGSLTTNYYVATKTAFLKPPRTDRKRCILTYLFSIPIMAISQRPRNDILRVRNVSRRRIVHVFRGPGPFPAKLD